MEIPVVRCAMTMKLFGNNTQFDNYNNHDYPTPEELAAGSPRNLDVNIRRLFVLYVGLRSHRNVMRSGTRNGHGVVKLIVKLGSMLNVWV